MHKIGLQASSIYFPAMRLRSNSRPAARNIMEVPGFIHELVCIAL